MSDKQNVLFLRITDSTTECKRHIERLQRAFKKVENYFPLTEQAYNNLTEEDIDWLDQIIYRYTKLQDKMGESLIQNISIMLEGESRSYKRTFIDYLNILEAYKIIDNTLVWEKLRELRNKLTHDYNNDPARQVLMLNNLIESIDILINIFNKILFYFNKYSNC